MNKFSKILTIATLILSPATAYAGADYSRGKVLDYLAHMLDSKDPALIIYLTTKGIRYTGIRPAADHENDVVLDTTSFRKIEEIDELSKNLSFSRWKEVKDELKNLRYDIPQKTMRDLETNSESYCRNYFNKVRQKDIFLKCQFKYIITFKKFSDDNANCKRDAKALAAGDHAEHEINKEAYVCMRNIGWKNPNNWQDNTSP